MEGGKGDAAPAVTTKQQLADEETRARKVRQIVDIAASLIMQSNMTREAADALVQGVRAKILQLFPDGEQTYELIYARRFRRLIDEFAGAPTGGVVIPFRRGGR